MTRDGHLVLMHDATVNRTTDGRGDVSHLTLSHLKNLDCGRWFDRRFAGEEVLTLNELFDAIDARLHTVVEMKEVCRQERATRKAVRLIRQRGLTDRTSLTSFYWPALGRAKEMEPDLDTQALVVFQETNPADSRRESGFITYRSAEDLLKDERLRWADVVCPNADAVDEDMVCMFHAEGFAVRVWGAQTNCRDELIRLLKCGIDGMTADYPAYVRSVCEGLQTADETN